MSTVQWHALPERSIRAERLGLLPLHALIAVILIGTTITQVMWLDLTPWWMGVVGLLWLIYFIPRIVYIPVLRLKYMRYRIDEEFLVVRHGIFFRREVTVPLVKVQLIDSQTGPILRRYDLITLDIRTASGFVTLTRLDRAQGEELRIQVERFAKLEEREEESL
ncbi:PH domain-containing protein [uncultured Exiguobacterium sp.]|uniref:PH domain-containing protein n=1 Tax=uncultured Exiguobacterium sp. TaxID=202669 RepID=UPI0025FF1215|nr:PH domain-containing protein [uncultured Exiguobacterium sp.]